MIYKALLIIVLFFTTLYYIGNPKTVEFVDAGKYFFAKVGEISDRKIEEARLAYRLKEIREEIEARKEFEEYEKENGRTPKNVL